MRLEAKKYLLDIQQAVDLLTQFSARAAERIGALALIGLFSVIPVSAAEKTAGPRDPMMRRIVAEFESAAAGVPRQFRADLARALARCGKDCEPEAFTQTVAKSASLAESKLTAGLQAADKQLRERAGSLKGPDGVLGAAGDLSRGVASLELASQRVAAEMTESLAVLKGAGFGGQPLLTTIQLRLASLVNITPITLGTVFTIHVSGSPTAWIYVDGHAVPGSIVTVTITCGSAKETRIIVTDSDGLWGIVGNFPLGGSKTCTLTAAGTGIGTGSITTEIHFP